MSTGFRRRPKHTIDQEKLDNFLAEAATSTQESPIESHLPEAKQVAKSTEEEDEEILCEAADDTRLKAAVNFRMTEKELCQLRYIAKYVGISINSFIRMAIQTHLPKGMELARKRKKENLF
jgi:predicted DNA binding CopG/RHH family protein